MSHYDTLLSLIVSGLDGKNGKITVTCAQAKASALNDDFPSILFRHSGRELVESESEWHVF